MIESEDIDETKEEETLPAVPVQINGLTLPDNELQTDEPIPARPPIGSGIPLESTLKDVPEKPSWLSQAGHEVMKMNRLALAGEFIYDALNQTPTDDTAPEGWSPLTEEAIEEFPSQYWDYITSAKSPNDLLARQNKAREQMEDDRRFADGSWSASLVGGAIGVFSDPSTYLLPLSVGGKYASIAQNIFTNMGKTAGGLAIDSVSRNLMIQADKIGGNLKEAATDSLRDFVFSTALVGIGGALGGGLREAKLWNTRRFFNFGADGINVSPVVNEEGIIIKEMEAKPLSGANVSAAQVSAANLYIDETMHMGGLFNVPFVGKPISNFLAWGPLASPVMKAQNSKSLPLKSFYNRLIPHGIITKGEAEGRVKQFTAVEHAEFYMDQAKTLSQFIRTKHLEANNLTGGPNVQNALKNFVQAKQNNQLITPEQFGIEVRNAATIEGFQSKFKQVHEVADQVTQFFKVMGIDYHQAVGEGNIFADPRNAIKYLPQNWNIPAMINEEVRWKEITSEAFRAQSTQIENLRRPITETEAQLMSLKNQLAALEDKELGAYKTLQKMIKDQERLLSRYENELSNHLLDNPDLHVLLEDRVLFNEKERAVGNRIQEPLRLQENHLKVIEAKLRPLLKEAKANPKNKLVQDKVRDTKAELEDAKRSVEKEKNDLQVRAREGDIEQKYFYREGDEYHFHNVNKKPVFRKIPEGHQLDQYVNQTYESIMNQSPDDLIQGVFGSLEPGMIENPAYLKERKLIFDTTNHNNAGFLDPDISKSITSYASNMGKIIGFKKAFPEFADKKGYEGVLAHFKQDYDARRAAITAKPPSEARNKELNNLQKERLKDEKFMSDTYKTYMGTYGSRDPETYRWAASLKNLVASAKLGAVPIYQLAELGAIIMKQGFMPFFAQGLRPMLKTLNGHLKGIEAEERRRNVGSAHLALWTTRNGYAQKLVDSSKMSFPTKSSIAEKVGVATDNLSHVSGNLFGINYIANLNETIAANIFQSDVMQAAFAHEAGKLSKKQLIKMARYGIDIKKDAKLFVDQYKKAKGFEQNGGYYSRYYQWEDLNASNTMAMAMRRMVKDTIVNGNRFNSPYWAQDPVFSMIFMFHGWAYSALNHYAVPLMQRPDSENLLGLMSVVGMSMLAEPLKRLANGKEAYDNDTNWFEETYKALDYSGIFGPYSSWFQDVNSAMGGALLPNLISEKYKNRPKAGAFGPVAGYLSDLLSTTGHGIIGDWTENDVKRFERLLPLSSLLPLRYLANTWIESMNLPQTRKSANSWAYRQALFGEGQ